MRAVARGMVERTLLRCPAQCGGPHADPSTLPESVRRLRERHGCDSPIPRGRQRHYAIRCPRCDGAAQAGAPCDLCAGTDTPGFLHMDRCPASCRTPDIADGLRCLSYLALGILPAAGGLGDQAVSFVEFRTIFEQEMDEARQDVAQD